MGAGVGAAPWGSAGAAGTTTWCGAAAGAAMSGAGTTRGGAGACAASRRVYSVPLGMLHCMPLRPCLGRLFGGARDAAS